MSPSKLFKAGTLVLACANTVAATMEYTLASEDNYSGNTFFDSWDFFTAADPTNGFVQYVSKAEAESTSLGGKLIDYKTVPTSENPTGYQAYMGVDHWNTYSPDSGRPSVRITSNKPYQHGLFVADFAHVPSNTCGTWPAFWTVSLDDWPNGGEIDILEAINEEVQSTSTLHTGSDCSVHGNKETIQQTGLQVSYNCSQWATYDDPYGAQYSSQGCSAMNPDRGSYSPQLNENGGGIYVMEWTSEAIKIWTFEPSSIPEDLQAGTPNPDSWPLPVLTTAGGSCDIDESFQQHQMVINTDFCGSYAGQPQFWQTTSCYDPIKYPTCNDYVAANPTMYEDAYWLINSIKVYQQTSASSTATSFSSTTSSTSSSRSSSAFTSSSSISSSSSLQDHAASSLSSSAEVSATSLSSTLTVPSSQRSTSSHTPSSSSILSTSSIPIAIDQTSQFTPINDNSGAPTPSPSTSDKMTLINSSSAEEGTSTVTLSITSYTTTHTPAPPSRLTKPYTNTTTVTETLNLPPTTSSSKTRGDEQHHTLSKLISNTIVTSSSTPSPISPSASPSKYNIQAPSNTTLASNSNPVDTATNTSTPVYYGRLQFSIAPTITPSASHTSHASESSHVTPTAGSEVITTTITSLDTVITTIGSVTEIIESWTTVTVYKTISWTVTSPCASTETDCAPKQDKTTRVFELYTTVVPVPQTTSTPTSVHNSKVTLQPTSQASSTVVEEVAAATELSTATDVSTEIDVSTVTFVLTIPGITTVSDVFTVTGTSTSVDAATITDTSTSTDAVTEVEVTTVSEIITVPGITTVTEIFTVTGTSTGSNGSTITGTETTIGLSAITGLPVLSDILSLVTDLGPLASVSTKTDNSTTKAASAEDSLSSSLNISTITTLPLLPTTLSILPPLPTLSILPSLPTLSILPSLPRLTLLATPSTLTPKPSPNISVTIYQPPVATYGTSWRAESSASTLEISGILVLLFTVCVLLL